MSRSTSAASFAMLLLASALVASCGSAQPEDGASTEDALTEGDPAAGYSFIVNGGYIGSGVLAGLVLTSDVLRTRVLETPVAGASAKPLLSGFGLFPLAKTQIITERSLIPGRNAENAFIDPAVTVFTTERGRKVVNFNCLICHSETINGAVVVGLGNTTRDFTGNLALIANALDVLKPTLEEGDRVEVQRFSRTLRATSSGTRRRAQSSRICLPDT